MTFNQILTMAYNQRALNAPPGTEFNSSSSTIVVATSASQSGAE